MRPPLPINHIGRAVPDVHGGHGVAYLAAPVFGRVPVAEAGDLNVLAAGPGGLIDRAQPLFDVIGARTWRLGGCPEQANIVKILGEAVTLAEHGGADAAQLVELLTSTLFPGATYTAYGELIAQRRYRPAGFTTVLSARTSTWPSTRPTSTA